MGYFSNSTEGDAYEARWCNRCQHQRGPDGESGCAVWSAHLLYNYAQEETARAILDELIPRRDGFVNGECRMFLPGL